MLLVRKPFKNSFTRGDQINIEDKTTSKLSVLTFQFRCGCDTTKAHWQRRLKNRTKIVIRSPAHSHGHVKKSFQYSCKSKKFLMRQRMWPILPWLRVNSVALYPFLGMYLSYSIAQIERISSQTQIEFRNWIATERILILLGVRVRSSQNSHPRLVSVPGPAGFFTALAWNCDVIFANPRSSRCHVVKSIPLLTILLCTPLNEQCINFLWI